MSMATWGLMLSLASVGPVGSPGDSQPIGHRVQVVEMRGLEWRGDLHARMTAIDRCGTATVWVASFDVASELSARAERTILAPKPASQGGVSGSVRQALRRPYVADVRRVADGPVDRAAALAFIPEIAYVEDAIATNVRCERMASGVRAAARVESRRLLALSTIKVQETVQPKTPDAHAATLSAQLQIPDVACDTVEGEWVIPHRHALIIGLGTHTARDCDKSETVERVAIVTPEPSTTALSPDPQAKEHPAPVDLALRPVGVDLPPLPVAEAGVWSAPKPVEGNAVLVSSPPAGGVVIVVAGASPVHIAPGTPVTVANVSRDALAGPVAYEPAASASPSRAIASPPAAAPPPIPPSRTLPHAINEKGEIIAPSLPPTEPAPPADPSGAPRGTPQTPHALPAPPTGSVEPTPVPGTPESTAARVGDAWVERAVLAATKAANCPVAISGGMPSSACPGACADACPETPVGGLAARDTTITRAVATPARPDSPRRSIALSIGWKNRLSVEPGRAPGSHVVRIPLAVPGWLVFQYRDDLTR